MASAAANEPEPIPLHVLRRLLASWFAARQPTGVQFVENLNPDPGDERYSVEYEASFEPAHLEQARIELWGATDGSVGVGFELRERLAKRLGVRCSNPTGVVSGHEPSYITRSALTTFLDAAADGQVAARVTVWPWLGITSARAVAPRSLVERLDAPGRIWSNWLGVLPSRELPLPLETTLAFSPWK